MAVKKAIIVPPKKMTSKIGTSAIITVSQPQKPAHHATRRASSILPSRAQSWARKDKISAAKAIGMVKNPVKQDKITAMMDSVNRLFRQPSPLRLH